MEFKSTPLPGSHAAGAPKCGISRLGTAKQRRVGALLAVSLHAALAASAAADPAKALAEVRDPGSREVHKAILELRSVLRDNSSDAPWLRGSSYQELGLTTDPIVLRRLAMVLAGEPDEAAVLVLAGRLPNEHSKPIRAAICAGLRPVLLSTPALQASTRQALFGALQQVLDDRDSSPQLVEGALLAAAAAGPAGFDFVVQMKARGNDSRVREPFYAILAETRDPRAVNVLLDAVRDGTLSAGLRGQAANALAMTISGLRSSGQPVPQSIISSAVQGLSSMLNDQTEDQLFAVALAALGRITDVNQNPDLARVLLTALGSESAFKREAALEATYAAETAPGNAVLSVIESLAAWDSEEQVRAAAEAVLDKLAADGK